MQNFDWPRDTVFVSYWDDVTFIRVCVELSRRKFHFVVDPNTQVIAMSEAASIALGLDGEK